MKKKKIIIFICRVKSQPKSSNKKQFPRINTTSDTDDSLLLKNKTEKCPTMVHGDVYLECIENYHNAHMLIHTQAGRSMFDTITGRRDSQSAMIFLLAGSFSAIRHAWHVPRQRRTSIAYNFKFVSSRKKKQRMNTLFVVQLVIQSESEICRLHFRKTKTNRTDT